MAKEEVQQIYLKDLHPFRNHPFRIVDDEAMLRTMESVAQFGVLTPLIARQREEGGYELVSGHRRKRAAELAGLRKVPVIVRKLNDDMATILMVDSNLQRENILPSERAKAYRMKLEAMKHQGKRTDLKKGTSTQVVSKLRSDEILAEQNNQSRETVRRYIRLTYLIPELQQMVDDKTIAFNPAVELSYLPEEKQEQFLDAMDYAQTTPSLSQAQRLKQLNADGKCTMEAMCAVMSEEKKTGLDNVTFKGEELRKYFPKSYTPKQMQDTILKLLSQWQKKKQREMSL